MSTEEFLKYLEGYLEPLRESIEKLEKQIQGLHNKQVGHIDIEHKEIINKQIAELQQKVSNPEWLDVLILDLMKPRLSELKEQFGGYKLIFYSELDGIKDLLRKFFCALDDYFESKNQKKFHKIFRKLHKKLEGEKVRSAAHTEEDELGIEGKYEVWTKEELINECYNLVSNIDALESLHAREKEGGKTVSTRNLDCISLDEKCNSSADSKPSPNVCSHGTYLSDICKKCNKREGEKEYIASLNDPKAFEGVNLGVLERTRKTDSKTYNPYEARSILLEPYQTVVEKKDIEEINELNYLSFKEKYLGGKE